jgi:glycosyltransferase involved in cell wall biosynthesis
MRIGIDARLYGTVGKGLGRYISELIDELEKLDQENEYVIFLRECNFGDYEPRNPRFSKALAEYQWYGWREQLLYPFFLRRFRLDLLHCPHFNVPLLYGRPFVVTVHDLILLEHPSTRATTLGPLKYFVKFLGYRLLMGIALRAASAVLTVSEFSKRDLERHFPFLKHKKVTVTYEAAARRLATVEAGQSDRADDRAKSLPTPYALYVGNAYPHKNLGMLVEAFAAFRAGDRQDYRLVMVGGDDYFYRQVKAAADGEHVTFFGRASDDELRTLYARASMYVFPSLYEGFGLPPLEAMQHAVPVISSNSSCLPEVLGDAAHYFDPRDPGDLIRAMRDVSRDETLRRRLIARGLERVKRYSWTDCAKKTLAVYRSAVTPKT